MTQPDVVEELRAEVERLRAIVNEQAAAIVQLDADNERLQAALQTILGEEDVELMWTIARAALEPKP